MVTTLTTKKSGIFFSSQARWKPRHIFQIYRIFHKSKVKAVFWDDSGFFNREIKKWSWKKTWSHHISNKETFLGIRHQTARFKCHGPVKPEVLLCRLSSTFKLERQKNFDFFFSFKNARKFPFDRLPTSVTFPVSFYLWNDYSGQLIYDVIEEYRGRFMVPQEGWYKLKANSCRKRMFKNSGCVLL